MKSNSDISTNFRTRLC